MCDKRTAEFGMVREKAGLGLENKGVMCL